MLNALEFPAASRRVGTSLAGRYRLLRLIGVGGMAAVYAGTHRNGHAVAIKILHDRLSNDPEIDRHFRREAQLANQVGHPAIVPVIDDDVAEDGCVFLVMPLLRGETLRARAERLGRTIPVPELFVTARRLLEALGAAHEKRIVHRDIKPENIFVTANGDLRVLDFGIARFLQANGSVTATRSGRAVGTPGFMAPEQALGRLREVDGRTDLWALGATLYTLASGRLVHEAETANETLVKAATQAAVPLASVAPGLPPALCAVVDRALAFEKAARWPTAASMNEALGEACASALGMTLDELPSLSTAGLTEDPPDLHQAPTLPPEELGARSGTSRNAPVAVTRTIALAPTAKTARTLAIAAVVLALGVSGFALLTRGARFARRAASLVAKDGALDTASQAASVDARRAYDDALAFWRGASTPDALNELNRACSLEPTFAAAHLRIAILEPFVHASTRSHFAQARQNARRLSPYDAALLEAVAPAMKSESDWPSSILRLQALQSRFPNEAELALFVAYRERLAFEPEKALGTAVSGDESLPLVWNIRANAYAQLDQFEDARRSFAQCLKLAPQSSACAQMWLQLEGNDAHCAESQRLAKDLIASAPTSPAGYEFLAGALFATTHSIDEARAALEQEWQRLPVDERQEAEWRDQFTIAILQGDTDAAVATLDTWEAASVGASDAVVHGFIAYDRVLTAMALGEQTEAATLASKYLQLSAAWSPSDTFDLRMALNVLLYRAGGISRGEFRMRRDAWLDNPGEATALFPIPSFRWSEAYAAATANSQDAEEALQHIPDSHPFFIATMTNAGMEEMAGRALLMSGRIDAAKQQLERASGNCIFDDAIEQTNATYELGDAYRQLNDKASACASYREVVRRWGNNARLVLGQRARQNYSDLHCDQGK